MFDAAGDVLYVDFENGPRRIAERIRALTSSSRSAPDLARITWDEARHTEIGHRALQAAGYDPFELRNRLTGSTCRGPMDPAFAMAEINLFGEVGVLKTINGLIDQARERNDARRPL